MNDRRSRSGEELQPRSSARASGRGDEALRAAEEALESCRRLEAAVGVSPQRALGVEGSGLLGAVDRLDVDLRATGSRLELQLDRLRDELRDELRSVAETVRTQPPKPSTGRRRQALVAGGGALLVALGTAISAVITAARAPVGAPAPVPPAVVQAAAAPP